VSQPPYRPAQLTITSGKVIARHPLLGERVFLRSVEEDELERARDRRAAPRRPREPQGTDTAGASTRRRQGR